MSKLKSFYGDENAFKIKMNFENRSDEKNEFQKIPLYARAEYFSRKYRIEIRNKIDSANHEICYYNRKNKLAKVLEVIDGKIYDDDFAETGEKRRVDMYNSAWYRAYVITRNVRGVALTNWTQIGNHCKIRLYYKIELTEDGIQKEKLLFFCKTKDNGKWKWTGNKVEVKSNRTPKEKCKIARYLFGEKGVTTKAIMLMLGYKTIRQVNKCVEDLRQGNCKCNLKNI